MRDFMAKRMRTDQSASGCETGDDMRSASVAVRSASAAARSASAAARSASSVARRGSDVGGGGDDSTSEDEASDGGESDGGMSDSGMSGSGMSDSGMSDGGMSDGGMSDGDGAMRKEEVEMRDEDRGMSEGEDDVASEGGSDVSFEGSDNVGGSFDEMFGYDPRETQEIATQWLAQNPPSLQIAQIPTGAGKTMIGAFMLARARTGGYYVTDGKSLVKQFERHSRGWNVGRVQALYGRDNYACESLMNQQVQIIKKSIGTKREQARENERLNERLTGEIETLEKYLDLIDKLREWQEGLLARRKIGMPCDSFVAACRKLSLSETERKSLWRSISVQECICRSCSYHTIRERAKDAHIVVMNHHLFFHMYQDLEVKMTLLDEAHRMRCNCLNLYRHELSHPFTVADITERLQALPSTATSFSNLRSEELEYQFELFRSKPRKDYLLYEEECESLCQFIEGVEFYVDMDDIVDSITFLDRCSKATELLRADPSKERRKQIATYLEAFRQCPIANTLASVPSSGGARTLHRLLKNLLHAFEWYDVHTNDALEQVRNHVRQPERFDPDMKAALEHQKHIIHAFEKAKSVIAQGKDVDVAPGVTVVGIRYHAPNYLIAKSLRKVWNVFGNVTFMSGTLEDTSQNEWHATFKTMSGIGDATCRRFEEVFDRNRVRIAAPEMEKYNFRKADEYLERILPFLEYYINRCEKSVFIIGPNNESNRATKERLRPLDELTHREHIDFKEERSAYQRFETDKDAVAVVYGSQSLTTGIDLPGRVGLVLMTRNFNRAPDACTSHEQQRDSKKYWIEHNYVRNQTMVQAAGRGQRRPEDSCDVVFLGLDGTRPDICPAENLRRVWGIERPVNRSVPPPLR